MNLGLLQHLNFCGNQNRDDQQTDNEPEIRNNHSYNKGYDDGGQERYY